MKQPNYLIQTIFKTSNKQNLDPNQIRNDRSHWVVVAHAFKWEAEPGRSLSTRPAWSMQQVPGQPGMWRSTILKK